MEGGWWTSWYVLLCTGDHTYIEQPLIRTWRQDPSYLALVCAATHWCLMLKRSLTNTAVTIRIHSSAIFRTAESHQIWLNSYQQHNASMTVHAHPTATSYSDTVTLLGIGKPWIVSTTTLMALFHHQSSLSLSPDTHDLRMPFVSWRSHTRIEQTRAETGLK